jgi:hypothetical protein
MKMGYTGTLTANHKESIYLMESSEEALAFLLDDNKSHFVSFRKGFAEAVTKVLGEDWKPATLHRLFEKTGIEVTESLERNIRNWKNGKSEPNRESAIQLCFALGFDLNEAEIFLCRVCGQGRFNPKDPVEIIYHYCLMYGKQYSDAVELKKKYSIVANKSINDGVTTSIVSWLWGIDNNDDEFIRQLAARVNPESKRRKKVVEKTKALLNSLKHIVARELGKTPNKLSYDEIANWLSGSMTDKRDMSFKESSLKSYRHITSNFLTRKRISEIENGRTYPSREDFILIFFFNGCFSKLRNDKEDEQFFDNFYFELNQLLDKYGMSPLYSRSAFDWMILKSVCNSDPITYWRDIIGYSFPAD